MRRIQCSLAIIACIMILFTPGCAAPTEAQIVDGINKAGPTIIYDILKEVPAQDTAKKDAQFISTAITVDILPFVQNNTLPASTFLPQLKKLLGSKITNTAYYGGISAILTLATMNVDLTAPAMTTNETAYIVASLTAIKSGCDGFVTGKLVINPLYDVHKAHDVCMKNDMQNPTFRAKLTAEQIAAIEPPQRKECHACKTADSRLASHGDGGSWPRPAGSDGQRMRADSHVDANWEDVRK